MDRKKEQIKGRFIAIMAATVILMIVSTLFRLTWPSLVQAGPTLPPRDPPTPAPRPDSDDDHDKPLGGYIELQVQPVRTGLWSYVEWQDSAGNWHLVDGWQGTLDGNRRWWVAAKDFGKGPFRWVVTQRAGGPSLGISESFMLPSGGNETVQVEVLLGR